MTAPRPGLRRTGRPRRLWPGPEGLPAGSISLSSSSHFALIPYSYRTKPVALPPGRAKLSTKPAPTGSTIFTNTIGTVRVSCCNDIIAGLPLARITSGASATNSAAYLRKRSASAAAQRVSICTLRPIVQPDSCSPCANAVTRAVDSGSAAAGFMSTPMRRIRSACCARAVSGHAAAPLSSVMNARLFTRSPRRRGRARSLEFRGPGLSPS